MLCRDWAIGGFLLLINRYYCQERGKTAGVPEFCTAFSPTKKRHRGSRGVTATTSRPGPGAWVVLRGAESGGQNLTGQHFSMRCLAPRSPPKYFTAPSLARYLPPAFFDISAVHRHQHLGRLLLLLSPSLLQTAKLLGTASYGGSLSHLKSRL
jgi:hypothetical protein